MAETPAAALTRLNCSMMWRRLLAGNSEFSTAAEIEKFSKNNFNRYELRRRSSNKQEKTNYKDGKAAGNQQGKQGWNGEAFDRNLGPVSRSLVQIIHKNQCFARDELKLQQRVKKQIAVRHGGFDVKLNQLAYEAKGRRMDGSAEDQRAKRPWQCVGCYHRCRLHPLSMWRGNAR